MARLDALPSIDIIHGFRGVLDFYLWKGLPCVRKWPVTPPSRVHPKTRVAAALFGAVIRAYSLLGALQKAAFDEDAADQPRTGRDIYVSAVFGRLHEANMSDFLTLLTECRDLLSILTGLLHALQSVDTDALQVRGRDQLFSFDSVLAVYATDHLAGGHLYGETPAVPAGKVWVVTNILAQDQTNPTDGHIILHYHDAASYLLRENIGAFPTLFSSSWEGLLCMDHQDTIRVEFINGVIGDLLEIYLTGYIMTKEA